MTTGNYQSEMRIERIDADAVCAQCGTVNPEDTLLCKTCGNNLRDQRSQRVAAERAGEVMAEGPRQSFLLKGLVALGILVVIWVALNASKIENAMVGAQGTDWSSEAQAYWNGTDKVAYDEMLGQLKAAPLTDDQIQAAQQTRVDDGVLDGRYLLIGTNAMSRRIVIGQGAIRRQDDRVLFVALLGESTELRGEGQFEGPGRIVARESSGLRYQDKYYIASGFAQKNPQGGYEGYGMCDFDNVNRSFFAYRIVE